jgi:hypothetical protein
MHPAKRFVILAVMLANNESKCRNNPSIINILGGKIELGRRGTHGTRARPVRFDPKRAPIHTVAYALSRCGGSIPPARAVEWQILGPQRAVVAAPKRLTRASGEKRLHPSGSFISQSAWRARLLVGLSLLGREILCRDRGCRADPPSRCFTKSPAKVACRQDARKATKRCALNRSLFGWWWVGGSPTPPSAP